MATARTAAAISAVIPFPHAAARVLDLEARGIVKHFDGTGAALDGVDLTVARGEAVALIGANGSGKSTFLRCCVRLARPDAGSIRLLDHDLDALDTGALRRLRTRIGFVFQRHNLVGRLCALTNVIHGSQSRRCGPRSWFQAFAPAEERARAMACLDRVGLADVARRRADRLSGGQSQRVAIARALMQAPTLVMADEPVASLDPKAGEEVMELFVELMRSDGLTLLFVSHNPEHALRYADRVVGLRAGRVVLDAPARTLGLADIRAIYG